MSESYIELDDLKKIKKIYGENMAHMCRELFPTILENKGLLYHILETHFSKSKHLYEDIINEDKKMNFKDYIYFIYDDIMDKIKKETTSKSVSELLKEKGYNLYECKNNEDIQKFKKYYAHNEELCTFYDPNRIKNYYIFFIVKENVNDIKREKFTDPKREDEYGVSILDLQFDKGGRQRVSIKTRYNHAVANPDATYSNNLENIASGLTEAFEKDYNFNIGNEYRINFELNNYILANDNKYYKYSYEINNIHYCPNENIIIDNGNIIDKYKQPERFIFLDYFILDLKDKKIILYDKRINDSFVDGLEDITNIEIKNEENYKEIKIYQKENEAIIKVDYNGNIISYKNKNLQNCGNGFLKHNRTLTYLNLPNLKSCGDYFLNKNISLIELNIPNLEICGDEFLDFNNSLQELDLPNLKRCNFIFLSKNKVLKKLNMPNLESCEFYFLTDNLSLQELNLPKLKSCGYYFLTNNISLTKVNLPNLEACNDYFLAGNDSLTNLNLPMLKKCGENFLEKNTSLQELNLPMLEKCGDNFIESNFSIKKLNLPMLKECGNDFLSFNISLKELNLPMLEKCGNDFLSLNRLLQKLNLPMLKEHGNDFLTDEIRNKFLENEVLTNDKINGNKQR